MSELKPCPFCGGKARYTDVVYFAVRCLSCGATGSTSFTQSTAISAWNTRPKEDELQAQVDRYEKALNELARLGNGDQLGNSHGNVIAQQALQEKGDE